MRILAIYGSNFGQAQAVLERVTAALAARGHAVSLLKGDAVPATLAIEDFDAVFVAASIISGRYQAYVRDFVKRHRDAISARPGAFISVNGTAPESSPGWQKAARGYLDGFVTETGWHPSWTATFAGALRYRRYGLFTRWIMKAISRMQGGPTDTSRDHEFTDWQAVDRFAAECADALARIEADAAQAVRRAGAERRPVAV